MQNITKRIDITQKHLMQPMQSGNGLRRDSIIIVFMDRLLRRKRSQGITPQGGETDATFVLYRREPRPAMDFRPRDS